MFENKDAFHHDQFGVTYKVCENGQLMVVGYSPEYIPKVMSIPESVQISGSKILPVFAIGEKAFYGVTGLKKIILPKSIKQFKWGRNFARCEDLEEINLEDTQIKRIPTGCFIECKSLKKISLPISVKRIEADAFRDCVNLTSVTTPRNEEYVEDVWSVADEKYIEDTVVMLSYSAFYNCTSLVGLNGNFCIAPTEEKNVFENCTSLTSVRIYLTKEEEDDDEPLILPEGTFMGCTSLRDASLYNLWGIDDESYDKRPILVISRNAFKGCSCLESVYGEYFDIDEIQSGAFDGCVALKHINSNFDAPDGGITLGCDEYLKIEKDAFKDCRPITTLEVEGLVNSDNLGLDNVKVQVLDTERTTTKNVECSPDEIDTLIIRSCNLKLTAHDIRFCKINHIQLLDCPWNDLALDEHGTLFNKKKTVLLACSQSALEVVVPETVTTITDCQLPEENAKITLRCSPQVLKQYIGDWYSDHITFYVPANLLDEYNALFPKEEYDYYSFEAE